MQLWHRRFQIQKEWYRMYRFFVNAENILEDTILVTGSDVNHIKNVLRMKIGEANPY